VYNWIKKPIELFYIHPLILN